MSGPSKSLDKNKRFAGVKTNDFVNKTRANEVNRSAVRPQGWANLGKINSRRIPPPANLPSLKSETGVNSPPFDPTVSSNHTWTSNDNPLTPNSQSHPTQQEIDSLPVNSPTPPTSADIDKSRLPPSWSTITAGNTTEKTPNLLALNDFPRLATTPTLQDKKSQSETNSPSQNPTFRPANLATWKDGGVATSRTQSSVNNSSQILPQNPGANQYQQQQQNMRMYQPQMWNYNSYQQVPPLMPPTTHQRINQMNDYKTPTILRNKDIEDLSKLTDNTWANTTQEVNYEEKIRFSDDEDFLDTKTKSTSRLSNHTRLIQDDEHLKQMQDNKNSELINALNIAKQRRNEQERHLRHEKQIMSNYGEQKPLPGYQTRPLLSSATAMNEQDNSTSRSHPNSSSFAMKSWSDQMDSFNYSSLHETSGTHESNLPNQHSPSQSDSSSQSMPKPSKNPVNDQWETWNGNNENRQVQKTIRSNESTKPKSTRTTKQTTRRTSENQQESSYKPQKQRYQPTPLIDTASIPPLMSVRSDLPPTDYYENENLYYDTDHQHYHQPNVHNRGYTTLGSYGRYRRGGAHRQQQYSNYNTNPTTTTSVSSAPTNRPKKNGNLNKKTESNNKNSNIAEDATTITKKNSSSIDDESIVKPLQSLVLSSKADNEKVNGSKNGLVEQKTLPESPSNLSTNKIEKKTSTTKTQKRTTKEQQYPTQQAPRHRNTYSRSAQEYDSGQNYYNAAARRTGQNTRHNHQHDPSSAYYYDQSQSHYNNRYNYSTDSYHQQSKSTRQKQQQITTKTPNSSSNNNNNNNIRYHSTSDNDQKEGEEWETASESSTNMRNGYYENTGMNEIKMNNHRGRTPPKKSFSNQRPNARQIFKYTNA